MSSGSSATQWGLGRRWDSVDRVGTGHPQPPRRLPPDFVRLGDAGRSLPGVGFGTVRPTAEMYRMSAINATKAATGAHRRAEPLRDLRRCGGFGTSEIGTPSRSTVRRCVPLRYDALGSCDVGGVAGCKGFEYGPCWPIRHSPVASQRRSAEGVAPGVTATAVDLDGSHKGVPFTETVAARRGQRPFV